ncbi:MAG: alkaline phosphatase family protein [Planctomycetes bacterium]|nr:alkaline phosphatase family protein [Planctomycetota bacterium]
MNRSVVVLSVPGLRARDVDRMPSLRALSARGGRSPFAASFPAVTWPVHASMVTGAAPDRHGVVANGFYWRDRHEVEMWTAPNQVVTAPQVWDVLRARWPECRSAAWFPMLSKGSTADYVCMPAPVHNPDGSESLWCYTRPTGLYGELLESFGHFPLRHFWGPMANIQSTRWIAETAVWTARRFRPDFFFIYLPHLDYAAQKDGPDSPAADQAVADLDGVLQRMIGDWESAIDPERPTWLVASEYVIMPVHHVSYPNRVLRDAGLLRVRSTDRGEMLDFETSEAWALVDHQFSHLFVRDSDPAIVRRVASIFERVEGIDEVLVGADRARRSIDSPRAGDVVLISSAGSWQAYYWWLDDRNAPAFARTVDIHAKPGYDPVELHFDPATRGIPLDARLVRGSHGAPVTGEDQTGVLVCSRDGVLQGERMIDRDLFALVLDQFAGDQGPLR